MKPRSFGRAARIITVVTHPFVAAKSAADVAGKRACRTATARSRTRATTTAPRRSRRFALPAPRRRAEGGGDPWRVLEARAESGTSRRRRRSRRRVHGIHRAHRAERPDAVSSQAAVVAGTDLGFPGLAPRMRAPLEKACAPRRRGRRGRETVGTARRRGRRGRRGRRFGGGRVGDRGAGVPRVGLRDQRGASRGRGGRVSALRELRRGPFRGSDEVLFVPGRSGKCCSSPVWRRTERHVPRSFQRTHPRDGRKGISSFPLVRREKKTV